MKERMLGFLKEMFPNFICGFIVGWGFMFGHSFWHGFWCGIFLVAILLLIVMRFQKWFQDEALSIIDNYANENSRLKIVVEKLWKLRKKNKIYI